MSVLERMRDVYEEVVCIRDICILERFRKMPVLERCNLGEMSTLRLKD